GRGDGEGAGNRGSRAVVLVAGLRRRDRAAPDAVGDHVAPVDHAIATGGEGHGQPGGRAGAACPELRPVWLVAQRREGDGLRLLLDGEGPHDGCRGAVAHVAVLRRRDRAGARAIERDRSAAEPAVTRDGEAHGQAGGRAGADREGRVAVRLVGDRTETDRLRRLLDGERLGYRGRGVEARVPCLRRCDRAATEAGGRDRGAIDRAVPEGAEAHGQAGRGRGRDRERLGEEGLI